MFMRHSTLASLLVVAAKWAAAQNFPSTTTTTTSATETDTATVTETLTTTTQLPDATTTDTILATTTLPTVTVDSTTTLAPVTTTSTAPTTTKTVTSKNCIDYHIRFGKNCCPKSYCRPPPKHYRHHRSVDEDDLTPWEREALFVASKESHQKRQNVNSTPCSQSAFTDFTTASQGGSVDILSNYNFPVASVLRVQDLYAVNVCGDVYLDSVKIGSTNCPALNGGNTGDYQTDPDAAVASGNFAYGDFNIPAGTHTVSFLTTYQGGQAYWRLSSQQQCELDISTTTIATVTQTVTDDAFTTTTLPPIATDTVTTTKSITTTPAPVLHTGTVTPAPTTTTLVPAPVKVKVCKQVYIDISCPRYSSSKLVSDWGHRQLKNYKKKTSGDLGVQCGAQLFIF